MVHTVMTLEPGEPHAGPWSVVSLAELVERLDAAPAAPVHRPRIVAIDGRGGAGKTTLVEQLRSQVPHSAVVHTDDVAWHHAFFDWADLLVEHVLEPLHRGEAVDYRPRAWQERGRPGSITVPTGLDTVWIEGTGIIRDRLTSLLDTSIWVQVDRLDAQRRLIGRDGNASEQLHLIEAWTREENPFMLRVRPWAHASLIVAGSTVLGELPTGHVAVAEPIRQEP